LGEFVDLDAFTPPGRPIGEEPADHEQLPAATGFLQPTARDVGLSWPMTDGAALLATFDRFIGLGDLSEQARGGLRSRFDGAVAEQAGVDGVTRLTNPAIMLAVAKRV
jgi:hypothetical protein